MFASTRTVREDHRATSFGRISGAGDTWVAEMTLMYGEEPWCSVSIVEFDGPRIARMTDYFGPAFPAPAWRAQWVELENATT